MALRSGDPLFSIIKGECRRGLKILLNGTKTEARSESIAVSRGLKRFQGVSNKGRGTQQCCWSQGVSKWRRASAPCNSVCLKNESRVAQGLGPMQFCSSQGVSKSHRPRSQAFLLVSQGSQSGTAPRPRAMLLVSQGLNAARPRPRGLKGPQRGTGPRPCATLRPFEASKVA